MSDEITEEHIRVAAYYIWAAEGFPEGMAELHWERARAALAQHAAAAAAEEAAEIAETSAEPSTDWKAEPAPKRPAAVRKTAVPTA